LNLWPSHEGGFSGFLISRMRKSHNIPSSRIPEKTGDRKRRSRTAYFPAPLLGWFKTRRVLCGGRGENQRPDNFEFGMPNLTLFILVWILTLPGMVSGGEKEKVNPKISLPTEVTGWKWDGKDMKYNSRTLFDYIDGAAELYLAYGFQNLVVRRLAKPGQPPIIVERYELASPGDAYGVFSFEHQDEPVGIGQGSEFGGGLLRFWKGRYFVSVYAEGEGKEVESAIIRLGRATADSIPDTGPEPKLIALIPGKDLGLVDKSIRYLRSHVLLNQRVFISHQNILHLSGETEAVLAVYLRERQKVHLLLIRYPNVPKGEEALQSFTKAYMPDGDRDRVRTEDRKWTFARQEENYVLIVIGAPREADGEALLRAAEEKINLTGR
jgi:hypothetical protein